MGTAIAKSYLGVIAVGLDVVDPDGLKGSGK